MRACARIPCAVISRRSSFCPGAIREYTSAMSSFNSCPAIHWWLFQFPFLLVNFRLLVLLCIFFYFQFFFFFFIDELASGGWRSSRWPVATSTSEKGLILPRWPSRRRDFQAGGGTLCKQVLRAFRSSRYDFIANHRSPRRFSREIEGGRKITNKCDYLRDNEQKERYLTDKRADWRRTRSPAAVFAISMDSTLDEVSRSVMKTDGNNSFLIFFFNLKSNQQQGH